VSLPHIRYSKTKAKPTGIFSTARASAGLSPIWGFYTGGENNAGKHFMPLVFSALYIFRFILTKKMI
jgi:hypothetical protein